MMEECDFGLSFFFFLQMREEKRKEMNNSKEMKKKGKEINYLEEKKSIILCMFGIKERTQKGKRKEKNVFLFHLFGLQ